MKTKTLKHKKDIQILYYVIVGLSIVIGVYLVQQQVYFRSEADYPKEVNTRQIINNDNDLDRNLKELDSFNMSEIDKGVSENTY